MAHVIWITQCESFLKLDVSKIVDSDSPDKSEISVDDTHAISLDDTYVIWKTPES